jgi:hypothetical protein
MEYYSIPQPACMRHPHQSLARLLLRACLIPFFFVFLHFE